MAGPSKKRLIGSTKFAGKATAKYGRKSSKGSKKSSSYGGKKKYSKRRGRRYTIYDAVFDYQQGGLASSAKVNCLGHSNVAVRNVRTALWAAALKKLFTKALYDLIDGTINIPINATDEIEVQWRESEGTTGTAFNVTGAALALVGPSGLSLNGIALYLSNPTRPYNLETVGTSNKRIFTRLIFRTTAVNALVNTCVTHLQGAMFEVGVESSLKLQNRTVEAAGDEIVDVNSMPLDCVMFTGIGQGPTWRKEAVSPNNFVASSTTNLINTDDNLLVRIPEKKEFERVKMQKKLIFGAGQIKINTLKSTMKMEFSKMMNSLLPGSVANDKQNYRLGKYELFMFERTMDVIGTAPLNIVVAYDLTAKVKAKFIEGRNREIGTMFVAGTYVNV